jgi:hypothetical protein
MPTDYGLEVRQSIITHLQGYVPLTALVSASRIFGEYAGATPTWPFIRYGLPDDAPFEATGWDGSEHAVTIHAFVNGDPGGDQVRRVAKQVVAAMQTWTGPTGLGIVTAEWERTNVLRDSPQQEENKYHAAILFAVAVAA